MAVVSRTRVCIKNLPPTATENELKEFLCTSAQKQETVEITDCKVLRTAKGKSRKVAFVGFRREEQAKYVVEHFHRTFLGMSRLSVEPATAKPTTEQKREKDQDRKKENSIKKDTPEKRISKKKEDILKITGATSSSKSKFWANDEDDDYEIPTAVPAVEDKDEESSQSSSSSTDGDDSSVSSEGDTDDANKDEERKRQLKSLSDLDFLRSKQTSAEDLDDKDERGDVGCNKGKSDDESSDGGDDDSSSDSSDDSSVGEDNNESAKREGSTKEDASKENSMEIDQEEDNEPKIEEHEKEENSISHTRLFVRNLPFHATEEELESYFSSIGTVTECHIPVDDQKRSKGFAFVAFAASDDAFAARSQLDKLDFQGRLLHILPARAPPTQSAGGALGGDEKNLTWKQKQDLARKERETGGRSTKGWSAGFVRGDAVVDNLADRLGLRKGDLLGVKDKLSSGDAAVRLALGETQIIEENREYFRSHGVDMDVLVSAHASGSCDEVKRSKTGILVKNLPYETREEELMKLFHVGEEPLRILLAPSRTIALVEYAHPSDAKRAFKKLAYRRFKHVPIYLEWAPLMAKLTSPPPESSKETDMKQNGHDSVGEAMNSQQQESTMEDDPHETEIAVHEGTVSATIYVKNLNFRTTESTLQEVFETAVGGVRAVRIPKKASVVRSNEEESSPKCSSMGYGFVELAPPDIAKKALSKLQGKLVDGHEWELSVSSKSKRKPSLSTSIKNKNQTKLMVRNVPFQATRQEILKLFGSFGTLRRVRLPKKFDGTHRGFAFVEFLTVKEAQAAMTSLSGTHLYGRHLVLEWASEDESNNVDKLRDKAKRNSSGVASQPQNKRIKFT